MKALQVGVGRHGPHVVSRIRRGKVAALVEPTVPVQGLDLVSSPAETLTKQATRAAYGWARPKDWRAAIDLLGQAARAGEPDAERQYALVTQMDLAALLAPPRVEPQSNHIRVGLCRGFAPPGFAEWLIDQAAPRLVAASVHGDADRQTRTARDAGFGPRQRDLVLAVLQERAAGLTQVPVDYHEPPNVISYEAGQEFKLHVDFIDPRVPEFQRELAELGQRTATFVTYLNDDFDGAETHFPHVGLKLRGGTGDAILFLNTLPNGEPDHGTAHFAPAPTRGRKWVLSQWIRSQPFPFRAEDLA